MKNEALQSLILNTSEHINIYKQPELDINMGWIPSCNMGMEESMNEFEYIVLANDDILMPAVCDWAKIMLAIMDEKKDCGALSAVSYNVSGFAKLCGQNSVMKQAYGVPYCAFYFVMLRSEAIKKVGLLDKNLPGGDDLDYCFRLKDAKYTIGITPQVFCWHHYAQTGKRVYGDYWDSKEHTNAINKALITKHGFKKYIYYMMGYEL